MLLFCCGHLTGWHGEIGKINITETVASARKLLETDKKISPALSAMFEMLLMIITLLAGKLALNSQNSSKPPSTDPNRKKKTAWTLLALMRIECVSVKFQIIRTGDIEMPLPSPEPHQSKKRGREKK